MKELTFAVNDFGGVLLHNTRDACVIQMMNVINNGDYDAYPNSTIGIGLKDFQFSILRDEIIDTISYNMKELISSVLPHINILSIEFDKSMISDRKVLKINIKFTYYEGDSRLSSEVYYSFNDTGKIEVISIDGEDVAI